MRWISCDPIQEKKGATEYSYIRNNPILLIDKTGARDEKVGEQEELNIIVVGSEAPPGNEHRTSGEQATFTSRVSVLIKNLTKIEKFPMLAAFGGKVIVIVPPTQEGACHLLERRFITDY
ncbi:hypothetical protein [Leptodesmis sp.]|uniref:hypothetical protein n=1 Tax=Leptodesmis sp. TaxID=3100501 RepID=UPI004053460D